MQKCNGAFTGQFLVGIDAVPNHEHLAKLIEGVKSWNKWRVKNREIAANLIGASLSAAALWPANLNAANLRGANLYLADLRGARLDGASMVEINLEGANLTGCWVYGTSVWNARLDGAIQSDLVITSIHDPAFRWTILRLRSSFTFS